MDLVELRKDQEEFKRLIQLATRGNVKSSIQGHIDELERVLQEAQSAGDSSAADSPPKPKPTKRPLKKITSYAWDQSDAFVKIYATNLPGVQKIPAENINCEFNTLGFNLTVTDLDGKDYQLQIVSLYARIVPDDSKFKIKSDSILIMLKKYAKEKWDGITEIDRKKKEKQKMDNTPKADEDPSAGIMNLMKKMYDDGDDDMKRTIAKAWTESQEKKASGAGDF